MSIFRILFFIMSHMIFESLWQDLSRNVKNLTLSTLSPKLLAFELSIFMNIFNGSISDMFTSMDRLALFCDFENFSVILNPNFIHTLLCNIMKTWNHKIFTMTKTLTKLGICTKFNNWIIAFQSWHQHLRPPVIYIYIYIKYAGGRTYLEGGEG